jgi:hypothetical protein
VLADFAGSEPPLVVDGVSGGVYAVTDGDVVVEAGGVGLAAHVVAADPHPGYLTAAEGAAAYAPIGKGVTNGDSHNHDGGDGGQIAYSSLSDLPALITYTPTSLVVTTGTLAAGTYADLAAVGGTTVNVAEVTGAPGFDVEVRFSGITTGPTRLQVKAYYVGSAAHVVTLDIWNYSTSAWDFYETVVTGTAFNHWTFTLVGASQYTSGGAAKFRFYHSSNGTGTHDLYIDYAAFVYTPW